MKLVQGQGRISRRHFLERLVAGGLGGWWIGCGERSERRPAASGRFSYDVSAFARTDPALLRYVEVERFHTGFADPRCLAVSADTILVGGDTALKRFDPEGRLLQQRDLPEQPQAVSKSGRVVFRDRLEGMDSFGARSHLTAIAEADGLIWVADAGRRQVLGCDLQGRVVKRFGGFIIPSPYFDLLIGVDGLLWVVNPGKHRIEGYDAAGVRQRFWGKSGMQMESFCGCCNPVYLAQLPDGRFVTSEKGLCRIKIYRTDGEFVGVVAGPEHLVKDPEQARRVCASRRRGLVFPVGCDARQRVYVLDPVTATVRIFAPREATV